MCEAIFKCGVINIKNNENGNTKVFRSEHCGYIPEYMNIYKSHKKSIPLYPTVSEPSSSCSSLKSTPCEHGESSPGDSPCENDEYSPGDSPCENDEYSPCLNTETTHSNPYDESSPEDSLSQIDNGFTVYGDKIDTKFKTYHPLLYDEREITIRLTLKCKKTFQKI